MINDNEFKPWFTDSPAIKPADENCVLNKPLLLYIPPGGTDIYCPAHGKSHRIYGPEITC